MAKILVVAETKNGELRKATLEIMTKARQEKLRQLKEGPSIQSTSGGNVKQERREADN